MYSFLLRSVDGGWLGRPVRQGSRPLQQLRNVFKPQYSVQTYMLEDLRHFESFFAPPRWTRIDSRQFSDFFQAHAWFQALCNGYRESNHRYRSEPGRVYPMQNVVGYDYKPNGGRRTIVMLFSSRTNWRSSSVMGTCDVPNWREL